MCPLEDQGGTIIENGTKAGIRALTVVGIQGGPKVGRDGDTVTGQTPGLGVTLKNASARMENGTIRVVVPTRPQREE